MSHVRSNLGYSERRVCRALGMSRSSLRYTPQPRDAEAALTHSMVGLAGQYGRYGYRRVHALLQVQGWQVSPWENGYCESFNGKLRDQLLNGEIFYTLKQAQVVIERWRCYYNTIRPHSALGYRPPAPETTPPEKVLTTMNQAA